MKNTIFAFAALVAVIIWCVSLSAEIEDIAVSLCDTVARGEHQKALEYFIKNKKKLSLTVERQKVDALEEHLYDLAGGEIPAAEKIYSLCREIIADHSIGARVY
jgi:hypothetical protein